MRRSDAKRTAPGWNRDLAAGLVILLIAGATHAVHAGQAKTVKDGIYADEQARRGEGLYGAQCAGCHAADLSGSGAPPLTGVDFLGSWDKMSIADLVEKISTSMPSNSPGSLSRDQATDLVAFILKSNKFPAGPSELASDSPSLKTTMIVK